MPGDETAYQQRLKDYFDSDSPRFAMPKDGQFDLALCFGGTVSAGAYTAGVLDFLFEALDEWERLKAEAPSTVPGHKVRLNVMAGTSGGALCAALAARAARYSFAPARPDAPAASLAGNVFYQVWVNELTIDGFLDPADLSRQEADAFSLDSLLNPQPLENARQFAITWTGERTAMRAWLADPLRVILTHTNLGGIPHAIGYQGAGRQAEQSFLNSGDYIRFALPLDGSDSVPDQRLDEMVIADTAGTNDLARLNWEGFSSFALASGAFPVGFPSRHLRRPARHYDYRPWLRPTERIDENGERTYPNEIAVWNVDWHAYKNVDPVNGWVEYRAVDGGAVDNQPVELARTALSGLNGRNPRGKSNSRRGVLFVDPFNDAVDPSKLIKPDVLSIGLGSLGALMNATRFSTADRLLASEPETYSRFMITPYRELPDGKVLHGGDGIAASGLGAFLGFLSTDFMRHDFFLGRRNAWHYLRNELILARDNPVFRDPDSNAHLVPDAVAARHHPTLAEGDTDDPTDFLPIIPLVGSAEEEPEILDWPKGALTDADLGDIRNKIAARAEAGIDKYTDAKMSAIIGWILDWTLGRWSADHAADFALEQIKASLRTKGLD